MVPFLDENKTNETLEQLNTYWTEHSSISSIPDNPLAPVVRTFCDN